MDIQDVCQDYGKLQLSIDDYSHQGDTASESQSDAASSAHMSEEERSHLGRKQAEADKARVRLN